MRKSFILILIGLLLMSVYVGCSTRNGEGQNDPKPIAKEYVGSDQCSSCHQSEYKLWKESHHFHSMEVPNEESVLGDFNQTKFEADGVSYLFLKKEGDYLVTETDGDQSTTYKITYTFGFAPLQQYLIETEDGKLQTLRASWDSDKNIWFNQRAGEDIPRSDWLHWHNQAQNWNSMCASCHSTDLHKNFNSNNGKYTTHFSEINVACEACHGPGSVHIELVNNQEYASGKTGLFRKAENSIEQVEMCAPCHSRRTELTEIFTVDHSFLDQFMPQTLNRGFYEPDGQISEEDYVYASFASSKMYHENVKCNDCHDSHSNKLKLEGNALCMQCHEPKYNTSAHHFHPEKTRSAQCVNCHMTGKVYMGNDFRRDHSFRIPRPDQSIKYGTSNACNGCHENKSAEWASTKIEDWYGQERPDHFSNSLLPGQVGDIEALFNLINSHHYPEIARATAIEYLSQFDPLSYQAQLVKWTKDSAMIRLETAKLLHNLAPELQLAIAPPLLKDEKRAVRLAAFRTLMNLYNELPDSYKPAWRKVEAEYIIFLDHNSDFREGQQNLAQYYLSQGNPEKASQHFKNALEIDSLFIDPYANLAILQTQLGQNEEALHTLNMLLDKDKNSDRGYYLRALLNYELNDYEGAASDLDEAIQLNPLPNYYYNAIIAQQRLGNVDKANTYLKDGLSQYPNDQRLQQFVTKY
ncbi:MAG: tetratricopeptide repeat protein [Schleiferiaceae bacterium]|nr:tetratricopeptide repeat protein [Schleiferiaceae bacterium]